MAKRPAKSEIVVRFRLRTLLLAMLAIAAAFAAPAWYDFFYRAKITPLTDVEARRLRVFGATPIRPITEADLLAGGERFTANYRPRSTPVGQLSAAANQATDLWNFHASYANDEAVIRSERRETLEGFMTVFEETDTSNPNKWVMRGIVVDASGRSVAGALVDLVGDYNQINGCRSRGDGTFFHVVDFAGNPPTRVYRSRFRVRAFPGTANWRYTTSAFTLTGNQEMQVRIALPVTLPDAEVVATTTSTAP